MLAVFQTAKYSSSKFQQPFVSQLMPAFLECILEKVILDGTLRLVCVTKALVAQSYQKRFSLAKPLRGDRGEDLLALFNLFYEQHKLYQSLSNQDVCIPGVMQHTSVGHARRRNGKEKEGEKEMEEKGKRERKRTALHDVVGCCRAHGIIVMT